MPQNRYGGQYDCYRPPRICLPEGGLAVWAVVYIASNQSVAEMLKGVLVQEGVLVMLRSSGIPHMGPSGNVEILVPEGEVEEAQEILAGVIGGC